MKDVLKSIIKEFQQRELPVVKHRSLQINHTLPVIITLIGARRSGKTYLLYQTINELIKQGISRENILFLNFEDERLTLQTSELDLILQAYLELYPKKKLNECYFFFDEIQNIEGWEKFVRRIFDNYSKHIFITGSNSKLLSTEIASSLRGRTLTYTIYPLSFTEYVQFKGDEYDIIHPQKKAQVINNAQQFIFQGGFPEVVNFDIETRTKVLQSYFNTMIYRDIIDRYKISDVQLLKFFIKKLYANITKPLSINKIYNELRSLGYKVSNNYLYEFENYSYAVFLGIPVPKFDFSEIKQTKAEKKMYSIDTGLLSAIEFSVSENKGKLLENAVLLEFIKAGWDVFYYKDKYECDFIVRKGKNLLPVQVTWVLEDDTTRNRELRVFSEVCEKLKIGNAQIVTFDQKQQITQNGNVINVVPFYEFVYQLNKQK
jgi:predicted AAA+ superfamily ATPase